MVQRICEICKHTIDLNDHLKGLVFDDTIFVCEECCSHAPDDRLAHWSHTSLKLSECGMPIGLWLIHEQNKDKPLFGKAKF
ncbi:MAG: hypothetical protein QXX20_00150 [Candidatus Thermoplasmatota archaeon]